MKKESECATKSKNSNNVKLSTLQFLTARLVTRSTKSLRTLTGPATPIKASGAGSCGGAAVRKNKMLLGVDIRDTLTRMKSRKSNWTKTKRSRKLSVFVAVKLDMWRRNVHLTLTFESNEQHMMRKSIELQQLILTLFVLPISWRKRSISSNHLSPLKRNPRLRCSHKRKSYRWQLWCNATLNDLTHFLKISVCLSRRVLFALKTTTTLTTINKFCSTMYPKLTTLTSTSAQTYFRDSVRAKGVLIFTCYLTPIWHNLCERSQSANQKKLMRMLRKAIHKQKRKIVRMR